MFRAILSITVTTETIQMFRAGDRETVVHPGPGIRLGNEREQRQTTRSSKSSIVLSKRSETTRGYELSDSIYKTVWEKATLGGAETQSVVAKG